jgi:glutaredoxin
MKKLYYLIVMAFIFLWIPKITMAEQEKINVYIFKSSTCPHCEQALTFFNELVEDEEYANYFNLVPFETNGSTTEIKENINLANKVAKYFGAEFEGVPLIIIGDKRYEGYTSSLNEQFKDRIKTCYEKGCTDVVVGIQEGTLKESNFDVIFIVVILVVLVGGIGYFIYIARKPSID